MNDNYKKLLTDGLNELEIPVNAGFINELFKYLDLYMEWNAKTNLSSIRSEDEVIIRHFLDSLSPLPFLLSRNLIQKNVKMIDLGTGGGFPGVVLKILNPSWEIDLAEVSKKKICFLNELILNLALTNMQVVDSSAGKVNQQYGIIFTRAFSSLKKIYKEARIYMKKGWIIAYKGKKEKILEELEELNPKQQKRVEIQQIKSPFLDEERHIAIIKYL